MNIAVQFDRNYLPYTCVMLASLCLNNQVHVEAFILNSELNADDFEDIRSNLKDFDIKIHDIKVDRSSFDKRLPVSKFWTLETYFVLKVSELIPPEIDRVLFLDDDLIINDSIIELYEMDFSGCEIIAAKDSNGGMTEGSFSRKQREMFKGILPAEEYFNTGVMLLNLDAIRKRCNFGLYAKAMEEWNYEMSAPDQDILNYVHRGRVKFIDWKKYDLFARTAYQNGMDYECVKNNCSIIHFAGQKPWKSGISARYNTEKLWWDYAAKTPIYTKLLEEYTVSTILDDAMEKSIRKLADDNHCLVEMNQRLLELMEDHNVGKAADYKQQCELSIQFLDYIHKKTESTCLWEAADYLCEYDLAVIIPCYQAEDFIRECMESVVPQVNELNACIIAVDDGSRDNTPEILDEYASDKVKVIHQENRGVAAARNTGLLASKSRYVYFLDADDMILGGTLPEMLSEAICLDADVLECEFVNIGVNSKPEDLQKTNPGIDTVVNRTEWSDMSGYPWGKLIRRRLFDRICYPENYWFEDSIIMGLVLPLCVSCYKTSMIGYAYRMNPKGATALANESNRTIESFYMMEIILENHEELGIISTSSWYEHILKWTALTYVRTAGLDERVKTALFFATAKLINDYFKTDRADNRFLKPLEEGIRRWDYPLYKEGCEIAWNGRDLGNENDS